MEYIGLAYIKLSRNSRWVGTQTGTVVTASHYEYGEAAWASAAACGQGKSSQPSLQLI